MLRACRAGCSGLRHLTSVALGAGARAPNVGPPGRRPTASSSTWRTASSATAPKGTTFPTSISATAVSAARRPIPSSSASCCAAFRTPRCRRTIFPKRRPRRSSQFLRAKASRAAASAGNAANGRAIFTGKGNCTSCHRVNGAGARAGAGPQRDRPAAPLDRYRARDRRARLPHRAEQSLRAGS